MPRISEDARLERRQFLIDAAWRCAGRMGYSELTVDDICEEAQVSKGAFYGYFSSKQDLLITLLEEDAVDLDGRLESLAQRNISNVERLRSFAREMCERGTDQARVQVRSDLWAAILTEPAIRERMVSAVGRRRAMLRGWIEEAVADGEIDDIPANAFASVLLALGDGLTLHGSLDPSGFRWTNIARVLAAIFAGLSGDEECSSAAGRIHVPSDIHRQALNWIRSTQGGIIAIALVVGAGGGLGAIVFRDLIRWFTLFFTGHNDYSAAGHAVNPNVPWLGIYFVILAPVLGGLIYGPLIQCFAPEARGHGVPEVMLAVAERGGKIRPQVAVVKSLASAICIGAGGSVGREGPIVQIGAALGSSIGQVLHVSESRLRLLVACGTAAGISATFNAPIAGVFFALELILQDFAVDAFGAVVLASVVADVIGRAAFGSQAFLTLPAFHIVSTWEFGLYAILGVLGGLAGLAFIRVLYGTEDILDRIWHGPEWLRPVAGGVFLGLLLLALPELYGVGYPVLQNAVAGQIVLGLLLLLLVGKMLATSLTIGIGGSGGVFAPSLFMGAMLGTAFGVVAHMLFHGAVAPAGAYGLVGMGAVFAGAARAPITAVIIIFELLTGDYTIILPLMVAIVAAAGLSSLLSKDTIYTLKLRRRGIDILGSRSANLIRDLHVRDAMQRVPTPLLATNSLDDMVGRFAHRDVAALPVVDVDGGYRGVVTAEDVETALGAATVDVTAGDLATLASGVSTDAPLDTALSRFVQQGTAALPVLEPGGSTLLGWLTQRDILVAYHSRLNTRPDGAPNTDMMPLQP